MPAAPGAVARVVGIGSSRIASAADGCSCSARAANATYHETATVGRITLSNSTAAVFASSRLPSGPRSEAITCNAASAGSTPGGAGRRPPRASRTHFPIHFSERCLAHLPFRSRGPTPPKESIMRNKSRARAGTSSPPSGTPAQAQTARVSRRCASSKSTTLPAPSHRRTAARHWRAVSSPRRARLGSVINERKAALRMRWTASSWVCRAFLANSEVTTRRGIAPLRRNFSSS